MGLDSVWNQFVAGFCETERIPISDSCETGNIAREGSRASLRDGFVCAKSLYAGIFDCERSLGQSHLRKCPGARRVAAKRSESQYRTVATSVGAHGIAKCQNTIRGIRVELVIFGKRVFSYI